MLLLALIIGQSQFHQHQSDKQKYFSYFGIEKCVERCLKDIFVVGSVSSDRCVMSVVLEWSFVTDSVILSHQVLTSDELR